jgi:hypothetical protein
MWKLIKKESRNDEFQLSLSALRNKLLFTTLFKHLKSKKHNTVVFFDSRIDFLNSEREMTIIQSDFLPYLIPLHLNQKYNNNNNTKVTETTGIIRHPEAQSIIFILRI